MSNVNADGVLLDPEEALLQLTQNLTNSLMAPDPMLSDEVPVKEDAVYAANGEYAGTVGGTPHMNAKTAAPTGARYPGGTAMSMESARENRRTQGGEKRRKKGGAS